MNLAINQTLSRTVLTSLTVFFSTAILLFFGGKVLEDFAFMLFIGVITGTYSTIYVAGAHRRGLDPLRRGADPANEKSRGESLNRV